MSRIISPPRRSNIELLCDVWHNCVYVAKIWVGTMYRKEITRLEVELFKCIAESDEAAVRKIEEAGVKSFDFNSNLYKSLHRDGIERIRYLGSLFQCAVKHERKLSVEHILKVEGIDPNIAGEFDISVVSLAASLADSTILSLLLHAGAKPNDASAPILFAVNSSSPENVRLLCEAGANLRPQKRHLKLKKTNAFDLACHNLIEMKSLPNQPQELIDTRRQILEILLREGAGIGIEISKRFLDLVQNEKLDLSECCFFGATLGGNKPVNHDLVGFESATIPAPAWTLKVLPRPTMVRMARQVSMLPSKPK
jgi:hypothetical protein